VIEHLRQLLGGVAKRARLTGEEIEGGVHVTLAVEPSDAIDDPGRQMSLGLLSSRRLAVLRDDREGRGHVRLFLGGGRILAPTPTGQGHHRENREQPSPGARAPRSARKLETGAHHPAQYPGLGSPAHEPGEARLARRRSAPADGGGPGAKVQGRTMARTWILDTETKGTGAEMVPLETVRNRNAPQPDRISVTRRRRRPRPHKPADPRSPTRFRVVDVMTQEVLADDADTRATVELLRKIRSIVDVRVYAWDVSAQRWRLITHRDQAALAKLR
jgi:hypothetical protein